MKKLKYFKNQLEYSILSSSKVFILPHIFPDCDAIGSSIGLYNIIRKLGKTPYIIINDNYNSIEHSTRFLLDEIKDNINVINIEEYNKLVDKSSLLILTDTNDRSLISIKDFSNINNIIIIDHHNAVLDTIKHNYDYINPSFSSASEIVYWLTMMFNFNFIMKENNKEFNIATYLLTGVYLDTSFIFRKLSNNTQNCIGNLILKGDLKYVVDLFRVDYQEGMIIQELIKQAKWPIDGVGIIYNRENPHKLYKSELIATAGDSLLKYRTTDVAIVFGFIDKDLIHVSGRSKGKLNIGKLMNLIGGGGNESSAAAKVKTDNIEELYNYLEMIIKNNNYDIDYQEYKHKVLTKKSNYNID